MRTLDRRRVLALSAAIPLAPALGGCVSGQAGGFDAVVGRSSVATLAAAINAAPSDGVRPFRILVGRGAWKEKLTITKPFVHLIGEDRTESVITFDAASGHKGTNGEPLGTRGCATLIVRAPGFSARIGSSR